VEIALKGQKKIDNNSKKGIFPEEHHVK